jgi:aerotaxis receptor
MNVRPITPLAEAREFLPHEIFFSTTDARGVILNGNDVFARVSGFSKPELIGRPHNIIRHPDMPRTAFALLWANLHAGKPFVGYVKNMAKDGRFYWVFVVVVPISGERFLSVRFKPITALLPQVEALYRAMLAAEEQAIGRGEGEKAAVAAGLDVAVAALRGLGFATYDSFGQVALNQEMKARPDSYRPSGRKQFNLVHALFLRLINLLDVTRGLESEVSVVLGIAQDFRLHAFNVNVAAMREGSAGRGLGVVADFLGTCATDLSKTITSLRVQITEITRIAELINTRITMAHLQMEMILFYEQELTRSATGEALEELGILAESFAASVSEAEASVRECRGVLSALHGSQDEIGKAVVTIEMSQVLGLAEAAHIPDGAALAEMFAEFRGRMQSTRGQLAKITTTIEELEHFAVLGIQG